MEHTIHGNTVFIKGNGIISHYRIFGNDVKKVVEDSDGLSYLVDFHLLGTLPLNTEAKLLNELREKGKI